MVGVVGLEPTTSWSQTTRPQANWTTPRKIQYASSLFDWRRKREALPQNGLALLVPLKWHLPGESHSTL